MTQMKLYLFQRFFFVCLLCPRFGVHFAAGFHGECHWWRSDPCFQGRKRTVKGWPMSPAAPCSGLGKLGRQGTLGKMGNTRFGFGLCRLSRIVQSWPVHEAQGHHPGYLKFLFFVICCMLEWLIFYSALLDCEVPKDWHGCKTVELGSGCGLVSSVAWSIAKGKLLGTKFMAKNGGWCWFTTPKTNMTMENLPFEDVLLIENGDLQMSC